MGIKVSGGWLILLPTHPGASETTGPSQKLMDLLTVSFAEVANRRVA